MFFSEILNVATEPKNIQRCPQPSQLTNCFCIPCPNKTQQHFKTKSEIILDVSKKSCSAARESVNPWRSLWEGVHWRKRSDLCYGWKTWVCPESSWLRDVRQWWQAPEPLEHRLQWNYSTFVQSLVILPPLPQLASKHVVQTCSVNSMASIASCLHGGHALKSHDIASTKTCCSLNSNVYVEGSSITFEHGFLVDKIRNWSIETVGPQTVGPQTLGPNPMSGASNPKSPVWVRRLRDHKL